MAGRTRRLPTDGWSIAKGTDSSIALHDMGHMRACVHGRSGNVPEDAGECVGMDDELHPDGRRPLDLNVVCLDKEAYCLESVVGQ